MKAKLNRKRGLVLVILILGLSVLYITPTIAIDPDYEVNSEYYTTNVDIGDSRTYVFDRIRMQNNDEFETRELQINVTVAGVDVEIVVAEGSKITVEIVSLNDTYIETKYIWQLIDGSVYDSDTMLINKSTLDVKQDNDGGPRVIFTTNNSLIKEVYSSTSWNLNLEEDRARISNKSDDGPYSFEEEYEYDLNTGFLMQFRTRSEGEGHRSEVELRETQVWNPNWFEFGAVVGDTNSYILNTMTMYDHYDSSYRDEMHILIEDDGMPRYIVLNEGDEISTEILSIDGDYIELELTFHQKQEGTTVTDEYPYLIDKSTLWATRDLGAPLLVSINQSFWNTPGQAPPGVEISDGVAKFHEEHGDEYGGSIMEGSWNLTTGWMQRFYNRHDGTLTDGTEIIQYEMEIIDADFVEDILGVDEGDSKYYKFTDILMPEDNSSIMGSPGSSGDQLVISYGDNQENQVTVQPGDTAKVEVDDIQDLEIYVSITFNSAMDGNVNIGSMPINLKEHTYSFERGPIFVVPLDEQMIKDIFKGDYDDDGEEDTDFTFGSNSVVILISSRNEEKDYEDELTYDLETGWLTKFKRTVEEDGDVIEKLIFVEATDISPDVSETEDTVDDNIEVTPIPLFPVICSLLLAAGILRKKRR
ncbi:MAG: hypothetical protein ACXADY_23880 [Candidatus Hodarchaeales archaeon]